MVIRRADWYFIIPDKNFYWQAMFFSTEVLVARICRADRTSGWQITSARNYWYCPPKQLFTAAMARKQQSALKRKVTPF